MVVLPDCLFVQAARTEWPTQDSNIVNRWIDPHHLKYIDGQWMKNNRRVITGPLEERQTIIKSLHDLLAYGHPGVSRTVDFVEEVIGGRDCDAM